MGYKFNEETKQYEFSSVSVSQAEATDTYVGNSVREQVKQLDSLDLVSAKMESIAGGDFSFDEIQADGTVKTISLKSEEIEDYLQSNKLTFEEGGRNKNVTGILH